MEPTNTDPTDIEIAEIAEEPLLQLFRHDHLTPTLRLISQPFGVLARQMVSMLPRNPERSTMLRKLREAKDCAITAQLWTVTNPTTPR